MNKRLLVCSTDLMMIQFLIPHIINLKENGYDVEIACSAVGDRMAEIHEKLDGIAVIHTVRLVRSPFSPENIKGYADMKKIISAGNFDIIWTNEPVMGVVTRLAARKARKSGTRVMYMVHGFHFFKGASTFNKLVFYPVEKLSAHLTDAIVTMNNEDYLAAKSFAVKNVYKINGIGVETAAYKKDAALRAEYRELLGVKDDELILFNVGELTDRKNQNVILGALAKLNNPSLRFFICGRGDKEAELKAFVNSHGLSSQVEFLGYRLDVPAIYSASDCFVFSSKQEGLPKAVMEAMAAALPVICSDIRGNNDLIENGKGGLLVENTPEAFAEAIARFAENPESFDGMGEFNAAAVKAYEIGSANQAVLDIINELTA